MPERVLDRSDDKDGRKPDSGRGPKKLAPEPKSNVSAPAKKDAKTPDKAGDAVAASGTPGESIAKVMQIMLAYVEHEVAGFRAAPREKQRALMAIVAKGIADRLNWAATQIKQLKNAVGGNGPLMLAPLSHEAKRLHTAIHTLFAMAKNGKLHMAENHLAEMFDREDALRLAIGETRAGRAEAYYDEDPDATASRSSSKHTPSAREAAEDLKRAAESGGEKPTTRAGYINRINASSTALAVAFDTGYSSARDTISEPPPAKNPGALESLLRIALTFITSAAFGALGRSISTGLNALTVVKGLEVAAGEAVKNLLVDAVKKMGETATKEVGSLVAGALERDGSPNPKDTEGRGKSLSPKTEFLHRAKQATGAAIVHAAKGFAAHEEQLRRLPTDTLRELCDGLDRGFGDFEIAYGHLLVREWVNFLKAATDAGVMNAGGSRLDNLVETKGVLRIDMAVQGNLVSLTEVSRSRVSGLEVRKATLAGVDPAVVANIASQPYSLQSLPIHRKVIVTASDQIVPIEFVVTRDYQLEPPKYLSKLQMDLLAKIAGFGVPGGPRETYPGTEAMPMLHVVFAHLNQVPASRISE